MKQIVHDGLAKFAELFEQSIITQSVITIAVVGAWVYIITQGQTPPEQLTQIVMIVVGFYFGSKVGFRQGETHVKRNYLKRKDDYPEKG